MGADFADFKTVGELYDDLAQRSDACALAEGIIWTIQDETIVGNILVHHEEWGWGAKDVYEVMFPFYFNCPLEFLKRTPVANQAWRRAVLKYHSSCLLRDSFTRLPEDDPEFAAFLAAVDEEDIVLVGTLLDKNPALLSRPSKTRFGNTAMHCAARANHVTMLMFLLDRGVDVDVFGTGGGRTPLGTAVSSANLEAIALLLSRGADPDWDTYLRNRDGDVYLVAMEEAAHQGRADDVRHLMREKGVNVEGDRGSRALFLAAFHGHPQITIELWQRGARYAMHANTQETLLHSVVARKNREIPRFLISQGADIHARNWRGLTPLHMAVKAKKWDIVEDLLEAGADPMLSDNQGKTPLDLARKYQTRTGVRVLGLMEAKSLSV